ncbi:energy-coupling factor transporter transmembrane component T family protein [Bacillus andreraoultii]|uniref:energy-coupling factor transporter transmembrane component T family protein n=1 Tax=Bacillus andreraoultii TaxID=1499685 RepID=UPI00053AF82A|nr:energy-coupling factor transporter transmembrane component T [Bacillus andreraoultii]
MKSMTLYVEKDTPIHKIDPITKIFFAIIASILPYILPFHSVALIVMFISITILVIGKVFRKIIPLIGLSMFLIISLVIIQGLFRPDNVTPLFEIGPITFYKEGLSFGLLLMMRVVNLLCAFGVLILTTKPDEMIEALIKRGMSPKIGYVIGSVLQLIPQMSATIGTIKDAQRSRGLETEGSLFVRMKAFLPLIGPVIMNSLISTRERSIALEVRGFNSKQTKTFLHEAREFKYAKFIQALLIIILLCAILWRIIL